MAAAPMLANLARAWYWIALRGLFAVLFGIFAFIWPGITLAVLVLMWGAYAIADGVMALIAAYTMHEEGKPMGSLIVVGILGIAAGVVAFLWPAMTALVLLLFIASWAVLMGIFEIAAAIRLRKHIENEWLLALSGVVSIVFGVLMFLQPGAGALAVVWLIGSFAIFFGILLIALGFRLKGLAGRTATRETPVGAHR
ncbi:MAG TPA: HdeD family acid-resistance protein [Candidatus Binatia bacterium]|nr:HdeD family acid-resistance protein [Candidatus Binatia bacterium]